MTDVRKELERGLEHHRAGNLEAAQRGYLGVLERHPNHAEANHLAGVVACQLGENERAVSLISAAIKKNGRQPAYHVNLGNAFQASGNLPRAISAFRKSLKLNPRQADAHFNLGNALMATGEIKQAVSSYRRALELQPDNPIARNNLGNALNELGKTDEAVAAYRQALSTAPDYPDARLNLGMALERTGDLDEALACYEALFSVREVGLEALLGIGSVQRRKGELEKAEWAYRRILEVAPDYVDALVGLGRVLEESGHPESAEPQLRRALSIAPNETGAINALSEVLRKQGRVGEALALLEAAVDSSPDEATLVNTLGLLLDDSGETRRANEAFRRAVVLDPNLPEAHFNLGITTEELDNIAEARAEFRRALALDPAYADAHRCLALAVEHVEMDAEIEAMARLFEASSTSDADRAHLGFGLAKAYDDLRRFDEAFVYLETANRLVRAASEYDVNRDIDLFERVQACYRSQRNAPAVQAISDVAPRPEPIFIVGMPRSGSTLIEQILASHSAVHGAGEVDALRPIVAPELIGGGVAGSTAPFPERSRDYHASDMKAFAEQYLRKLSLRSGSHRFITDKTLENVVLLGLIHDMFPDAPIVYCRRDPMDTCLSCYERYFAGALDFSYDLVDLSRYHRAHDALMSHWRDALGDKLLDFHYEALVEDQETQTRRLLAHCGLTWEPQCLQFQDTERAIRTASRGQVRQPLYSSAVGRWRRYESHLGPLREALRD